MHHEHRNVCHPDRHTHYRRGMPRNVKVYGSISCLNPVSDVQLTRSVLYVMAHVGPEAKQEIFGKTLFRDRPVSETFFRSHTTLLGANCCLLHLLSSVGLGRSGTK